MKYSSVFYTTDHTFFFDIISSFEDFTNLVVKNIIIVLPLPLPYLNKLVLKP